MKKPKTQTDRLLMDSPILDQEEENVLEMPSGLAISGQLNIGKNGNPVTIYIEDEETGETLEVNHVSTALLVIEDSRRSSSGWLSIAIGSLSKLSNVLEFLSKVTLSGLEKLTRQVKD